MTLILAENYEICTNVMQLIMKYGRILNDLFFTVERFFGHRKVSFPLDFTLTHPTIRFPGFFPDPL